MTIVKIIEVAIPVVSTLMIIFDIYIPVALVLIAAFVCKYVYNLFSFVRKAESGLIIGSIKVIVTFLIMHIFVIFIFSMAYAGITKIEGNEKGLYTSNNERIECDTLEGYFNIFYFSVVTATTLGYGDIHPRGVYARLASLIEVILLPLFAISLFNSFNKLGN